MILKKCFFKYSILSIFLLSYFCIPSINKLFTKEINLYLTNSFFAKGLYDDEAVASNTYISVKDFIIEGDTLYVFPLDRRVVLPIDVMIVAVDNEEIEVIGVDKKYIIGHFNREKNLYQFVNRNTSIGNTDDFYVIKSDFIEEVASRLVINYEKV